MHRTTLFTPPPPRQTGGPRGRDDALPAVGRTGTGANASQLLVWHLHRLACQCRQPRRRWLRRARHAGPHEADPLVHQLQCDAAELQPQHRTYCLTKRFRLHFQ